MKVFGFTTCSLLVTSILSAKVEHEVTELPGLETPLVSKMYSGILPAGSDENYTMFHHYAFIESENDPSTDPLMVWTNGGPGASSFFGLFIELGPYQLTGDSLTTEGFNRTGIPTLFKNPYAWTKVASVLILNGPPPVGYSYCDPVGPAGDGYSCGDWNDERTAFHNYEFLKSWLTNFPEFQSNELFLVGESYAGVYVPTLAQEILKDKDGVAAKMFKGFAVGDPCAGSDFNCGNSLHGPYFKIEFFYGHNQFSTKLKKQIDDKCPVDVLISGPVDDLPDYCNSLIDEMYAQIGGYYPYNLFDTCWYQNDRRRLEQNNASTHGWRAQRKWWDTPPRLISPGLSTTSESYPCGGYGALNVWVNTAAVKAALHVEVDASFFTGDNGVGFNYDSTLKSVIPIYQDVAQNTDLRVLVFSGDTDPGLNTLMTQNWVSEIDLEEEAAWRPWTIDGKEYMGGYVTRYATASDVGALDFLTIRGAGHMVPEYKPKEALEMITRYLKGETWKPYNKNGQVPSRN